MIQCTICELIYSAYSNTSLQIHNTVRNLINILSFLPLLVLHIQTILSHTSAWHLTPTILTTLLR